MIKVCKQEVNGLKRGRRFGKHQEIQMNPLHHCEDEPILCIVSCKAKLILPNLLNSGAEEWFRALRAPHEK